MPLLHFLPSSVGAKYKVVLDAKLFVSGFCGACQAHHIDCLCRLLGHVWHQSLERIRLLSRLTIKVPTLFMGWVLFRMRKGCDLWLFRFVIEQKDGFLLINAVNMHGITRNQTGGMKILS